VDVIGFVEAVCSELLFDHLAGPLQ